MDEGFKKKKFLKPQVEVIDEKDSKIAKSLIQDEKLSAKSMKFLEENRKENEILNKEFLKNFEKSDDISQSSYVVYENQRDGSKLKAKVIFHFFAFNMIYLNLQLFKKVMLCHLVQQTYKSNDHFFGAIWELGILFSFISLFANSLFQFFFKNSNLLLYRIHNFMMLSSINDFLAYLALYALGSSLLDLEFNFLIFAPQLLISILTCINQKSLTRKILHFTLILEWTQNIIAIMNFKWELRWTLILVYYESLASLQFLITFCLFVGFIPFIIYIYSNREKLFNVNYAQYLFVLVLANYFYLIWNGLFYFNFLNGMISLLRNDLVYKNVLISIYKKQILLKTVDTYMPLGIFLIFLVNFFAVMIFLIVLTSRSRTKEIVKLYDKLEKIEFQFIQIQETLLDRNKNPLKAQNDIEDDDDDKFQPEETQKLLSANYGRTKCLMCKEKYNKIIIMPCGHSGFCKKCFKTYWKSNKQCPICSNHIEQIILFYFNKENDDQKPIPQYLSSLRSNISDHKDSIGFDE